MRYQVYIPPWSKVLVEELRAVHLAKKFPAFYGTRKLLPCSQDPVTGTCLQPDGSSPQLHTLFL